MAKPIITLNGLKIVIMLGMLVIILCGIRFAAEIIVPFILALFIAVILNPLVQHMVRWRVPRVLAVSILMTIIVMAMVLLLAYLGSALNELTRTLPQYRNRASTTTSASSPTSRPTTSAPASTRPLKNTAAGRVSFSSAAPPAS